MFWILKIRVFMILAPTILFISLVDGLKCLECLSIECRKGDDKHTNVNCGQNSYCSKSLTQEFGKKDVERECFPKEWLYNSGLRLNECGFDSRFKKPKCICDVGNYCNSGYDFILPTGLKCLKCLKACANGTKKPTMISCKRGYYCEKYSYIGENNKKGIYRNCHRQEDLLSQESPLNDCGILGVGKGRKKCICYCNMDGCNSGDNLEPKSNVDLPPAIDCQQCDDNTNNTCLNETHKIHKCEKGYICYKLFEIQSNVNRVVLRGCIHKEYSLDLGLKLNECGQFTNSTNEKQPICICNQDNCNSGGWLKTGNQTKEKESPCPNSVSVYFNQVFVISTMLIGFIQILIFNN